jgi:ubiquinone/menaquinone biosynthesis C-methylase UbiE
MNCDPIARAYRWFEYAAFGKTLERCRTHFLNLVDDRQHALMLGDGDGRFLANYLRQNVHGLVDSVDVSRKMQDLSRDRAAAIPGGLARVRFVQADARKLNGAANYDLVVSHFFLDCLSEEEIEALTRQVRLVAEPNVLWLISEFKIPTGAFKLPVAAALIRVMYEFFAHASKLEPRRLPDYRSVLERCGFDMREEYRRLGGFVVSELWGLRNAGDHAGIV